jgi:putative PIN family toxin of toxin-antitoxin system
MRVVLDSNILARATPGKTGPARELVLLVTVSPHLNILSPFLLLELSRVLRYDRLRKLHGLNDAEIDTYVHDIQSASLVVTLPTSVSVAVVPHDPQDNPIVATAIAGQAEVLCTRDRHLLHPDVQSFCAQHKIQIMGDIELLQMLRAQAAPPTTP